MSKAKKSEPVILQSREACDTAVSAYVQEKLSRAEAVAQMEQEVAAVQERYQKVIMDADARIETLECAIQVWSLQHRKEFGTVPGGNEKSIDFILARVGFRLNPAATELTLKKDSWPKVAKRFASVEFAKTFLREVDDVVDKDALIRAWPNLTDEQRAQLRAIGAAVEQEEMFYIKPKSEIADAVTKKAA
jgi:phage host-nuclease inhibitor protein Gam